MSDARRQVGFFSLRRLACALVLLSPVLCSAQLVVVATPSAKIDALSREQVADVYLGKVSFLPGIGATLLLDHAEASQLREEFYLRVAGRSAAQAKSYWAKLVFTGKGRAPREVASTNEIKRIVANTPGALAYLDRAAVDDSVKVVYSSY